MTSPDSEVESLSAEMKHLSIKMQALLDRKKILCVFQELRNHVEYKQTEEAASNQQEIDDINDKLKELGEKKAELTQIYDNVLNAKTDPKKEDIVESNEKPDAPVADCKIFFIESPPTVPAPTVILDVEKLPPHPCKTQCPECEQFIMTETFSSTSSVTWLMCMSIALIGGVAGCCLIPFFTDRFKTITHKCPRCRTTIRTIKRL